MIKKQGHKIFNLIVMIIGVFILFGVLNNVYASDSVIYSANQDYVDEEEEKPIIDTGTMWSNVNVNNFFAIVRKNVAKWYIFFRYLALVVMLIILMVLCINLAFSTMTSKKISYKKMLIDWAVCFILLYLSHYFMIAIQYLNDFLLNIFRSFSNAINTDGKYDLFQTVKSRAYDIRFTIGYSGMILYITLVYLTIKYIYIYAKRFIYIIILTILAPITMLIYSVKKILTGKSKVFSKWMEEYALNVLIQSVHALVYSVFVGTALKLTNDSIFGIFVAFIFMGYISNADKLFRNIFKFSDGSSMAEELSNTNLNELVDNFKTAFVATTVAKQTGLGQKVGEAVSTVGSVAAISTVSFVNNKIIPALDERTNQNTQLWKDAEIEELKRKIEKAKLNQEQVRSKLNNSNSKILDEDRKLMEEFLRKNELDEQKYTRQMQSYTEDKQNDIESMQRYMYRRGIFERLKDAFDYDNYTEFVRVNEEDDEDEDDDDNSKKNILKKLKAKYGLDENGNIVRITNGKNQFKRRLIRSKKVYNAEKGTFERIGGVKNKFSSKLKDVFGFTDNHKELIKEAKDMIKDEVLGFGALLLGMGNFLDNPSLGFSLLAIGTYKSKKVRENKDPIKLNRRAKRAIKKVMNKKNKEYKKAKFSTKSILSIDETIKELTRTDVDVENINHRINKIKYRDGNFIKKLILFVPTVQFRLLGEKGVMLNSLDLARRMAKQHMDDIKEYERTVDVELMKSLALNIKEANQKYVEKLAEYITEKDNARLMFEERLNDGTIIITENGKTFAFNTSNNTNVLSVFTKVNQAIINSALKNYTYNFDELDIKDSKIRKDIINNLIDQGIIKKNSFDENKIDILIEGKSILEKNSYIELCKKFIESEHNINKTYIVDLQATVMSGLYKQQKAIVQPVKGVTIEDFAESIVGKDVVGQFNGAQIDSSKYSSSSEIVDYYNNAIRKYNGEIVHPENGTTIKEFAQTILGKSVKAEFNGIQIDSSEYNSVDEIIDYYNNAIGIYNNNYSENNDQIVHPENGTTIKEFAQKILEKPVKAEFNGIEIDSSKYNTVDEIVDYYNTAIGIYNNNYSENNDQIVHPENGTTIEEFAQTILEKSVKAEFNGIEIDGSKFDKVEDIVKEYNSHIRVYNASDNTEVNKNNILYSEQLLENIGVEEYLRVLGQVNPNLIKSKLYEQKVNDYIRINKIQNINDLKNPRAKKQIQKFYLKSLNRDPIKKTLIHFASEQHKNFSNITMQDLSNLSQENIASLKRMMFSKMDSKSKKSIKYYTNISNSDLKNMLTSKVSELNEIFDNVILNALINSKIADISLINLNSPIADANINSLKWNILNSFRMNGFDKEDDEDLIAIAQSRIESITDEQIENAIIGKTVSDFIIKKCDGDPNKLKDDESLSNELSNLIFEQLDQRDSSSEDEQKAKAENVIELLLNKKRDQSQIEKNVSGDNMVFDEVKEDSEDSNFDKTIPFPEVKTDIINETVFCEFFIPDGLENVKLETCIKPKNSDNPNFIQDVDLLNLSDPDYVILARLTRGEKYGPTLIINYPQESIDIVNKIQNKIADSQNDELEDISSAVLENIKELNGRATPEDTFGSDVMGVANDPEVERLFKEREIEKSQNVTLSVVEKLKNSRTSLVKEDNRASARKEIQNALLNNELALGLRVDYDNDDVEYQEFKKATDELVKSLLQMRLIQEDAVSLKMKKDSKNNKKFIKAIDSVEDYLKNVDIDEIIQSIYDRKGV